MHPNAQIIADFYTAFAAGNADDMQSHYAHNVVFTDPAFGTLRGAEAGSMWQMLIKRSKGKLKITYKNIAVNDTAGTVEWQAEYVFSQTNRPVINTIKAAFVFENGKIVQHTDHFNMWLWTKQALGWKGWLLGWTDFMQTKIQEQAKASLKAFMQ